MPAPGKLHGDLEIGAGALPGAHLADAERRVAQLDADLQARAAAESSVVVVDDDLAGFDRGAAAREIAGRAAGRERRRHVRDSERWAYEAAGSSSRLQRPPQGPRPSLVP